VGDRVLYIEIKVTHGVEDKKLEFIRENNLNVVEYDFSKLGHSILTDEITAHLTKVLTTSYEGANRGFGWGRWVNHCKYKYVQDELTADLRKRFPPKPPWEVKKNLVTF